MIARRDSLGRPLDPPPGHIDPRHIAIGRPQYDDPGFARILLIIRQSMGQREYPCYVRAGTTGNATARCQVVTGWVS